MDFSQKKLPIEAAQTLRVCPIHGVAPYALMLAPVYVFMKMNEKFVSVKAPLDFFTPEELERMKPFESFYMPEFVETAIPFSRAARTVRAMLKLEAQPGPSPYELSDACLRAVGPLWSAGVQLEPFFVGVFANELCDVLPGEILQAGRDGNVEAYELGVFRSALAVFLALHLGYCDLKFLNELRLRVFEGCLKGAARPERTDELAALMKLVERALPDPRAPILKGELFSQESGLVAVKIAARLERVASQLIDPAVPMATIHGPKGFVDV